MSSSTHSLEATQAPQAHAAEARFDVRIENARLEQVQWWVALATVGIPSFLTAVALWRLTQSTPHPLALGAFAALHMATMLGITVGFHRFGAHRAFQCSGFTRAVLVVLGSMAAQGPLLHWVSNHRRHHQFSDEAGDIHSPWNPPGTTVARFWHAHIGWMFEANVTNPARYSRDLMRDPALMRLSRRYFGWVALGVFAPPALAWGLTGSSTVALDVLLWAGFVRLFTVHHATWSINSITHLWGTRRYRSSDHSVDVAWLVLPSAGEAWHNGHHAFPGSARFSMAWHQFDPGYALIRTLEVLGLARQVNRPTAEAVRKARLPRGALTAPPNVSEGAP